jgi:hypothetical protein
MRPANLLAKSLPSTGFFRRQLRLEPSSMACCQSRDTGELTLVDAHLKGVPGLGTLTARSLTGSDLEALGGQADGTLDAELLVLRAVN